MKYEIRFYACLLMGFSLLSYSAMMPPPGAIEKTAILAAGILFAIGGLCVGLDVNGVLDRLIKLRETERDILLAKKESEKK